MGRNRITILHPQPCIKNNTTKTPPKGIPKKENIKPVSTKPPVMGQVKILKRGEVLGDTLKNHHSEVSNGLVDFHELNEVKVSCEKALPTKKKLERKSRKAEVSKANKHVVLSSTNRLGPNPKIVPKELSECFAGFGFPSSPHPSSLPLPGFSVRNCVSSL